jgi:hypothetical protein
MSRHPDDSQPRLDALWLMDFAKSARRRARARQRRRDNYPRKSLILLALWIFACGLALFSSIFGDLTRSF